MSKDKKFTYEFVERDEENPLNDRVVKKGVEVEFNMYELDNYTDQALRTLDEYRGKLNIEDAKIKNVEQHHDDAIALVRNLDPVKQNAIHIWLKSKEFVDAIAPKRDELEKALKEHEAEIAEIKKQLQWEPPVTEDNNEESADNAGGETDKE